MMGVRGAISLAPGDANRPASALDGNAISVVADQPCQTLARASDTRRWLESHSEHLAFRLYRYLLAGHFQAEPEDGLSQETTGDQGDSSP